MSATQNFCLTDEFTNDYLKVEEYKVSGAGAGGTVTPSGVPIATGLNGYGVH
jgi:hypothetical protein